MTPTIFADPRIVMTLDAGGTNFRFSAMRGGKPVTETIALPSNGDNLEKCLATLVEGFTRVRELCPEPPVAISFAFPGPCDYPNGIIGDLGNLPAFRGGIAAGPMLEEIFGIPVFLNNDGDLFAYGEAIGGLLPYINELLEKAGSPRRYRNLFGMTLGTGLGGGIVRNGDVFIGDNSIAAEVWMLRNKLDSDMIAEEGACIRAVRNVYAAEAGIPPETTPEPAAIYQIGMGEREGNQAAAREAFRRLGEVAGDVIGTALAFVDGLAVIGGGVSGGWPLFLPALVTELRGTYGSNQGRRVPRLPAKVYNLEDPSDVKAFLAGDVREITIPGTSKKLKYDPSPAVGVAMSRLGTSEAIALGAYAFALQNVDRRLAAPQAATV
ncbi:MAG: glucokinase [Akkermansiaceae bacterium]|nr:glucokinase [Akkermansiaceae bacterium]